VSTLLRGRILTGAGDRSHSWLRIDADHVLGTGDSGDPGDNGEPGDTVVDLGDALVVPGFVDLHGHGGGGGAYTTTDADEASAVADFHLRHGSTTAMASLVTAELDLIERQIRTLAPLVDDGILAGIHLEGPWLSYECRGAHDPALLRDPDPAEVDRLLRAGDGRIRMVTLAPERPGGLAAIRQVIQAGAIAAVGHTAADVDTTRQAVEAGASVATHLFNGMSPIHHRAPGPVVALLESPEVTVELIADGHHLHPAAIGFAVDHAGRDRVALITDAMAATGMGDGDYDIGGRPVSVRGGLVRLAGGTGSIAGSTLTTSAAARYVASTVGRSWHEVVTMAATTPARALGRTDIGSLEPGRRADLLVLGGDGELRGVMRAGRWVVEP